MISIPRERRDTSPSRKGSFKLGYFQNAQYDGGGTFLKWLTPQAPIDEVAAPLYVAGRYCRDQKNLGPIRERMGGPFTSLRYSLGYNPAGSVGSGVYTRYGGNQDSIWLINKPLQRYIGGFAPPANTYFGTGFDFNNLGPLLVSTNSRIPSMSGLGERGWKASKPKLEKMSLFQDVFESNEIPGQFTGTRDFVHRARETAADFRDVYVSQVGTHVRGHDKLTAVISQEFLNANFGWLPFLKGIYDLTRIIGSFRNLVQKFTKLNGKPFRKRASLINDEPTTTVLSTTKLSNNGISYATPVFPQSFPAQYFRNPPHWELHEINRVRQWAVGKWTYYRPEFDATQPGFDSEWNRVKQAMTISGLRITPSALYNVVPWTWLLDWVTNVGDYVDELTDIWFDQIVNHYCFVMQAQETVRQLVVTLPFSDTTLSLTFSRVISSKQRGKAASPFGFDLDASDLSGRQLGILAALATSRRRG